MERLALLPLIAAMTLVGCGSQPLAATAEPVRLSDQSSSVSKTEKAVAEEKAAKPEVRLPAIPLTDELLYKFLLSEIAGQRGMITVAKEGYLDLARQTKDPRVVKRAAEIAVFSRDADVALETSRLWLELEPASPRALQTLVALLVSQGRLDEATPYLEKMLSADEPANGFMHLSVLFSKTRDTKAAFETVRKLASSYPDLPEGQYALAQSAIQAGRIEDALEALKRADTLRPGWETAATLRAQLMTRQSRTDALNFMKGFLQTYPQSREVRLAYARMLVNANQFDEAREQFTVLTGEMPDNADVHVAAGLLSLQMADPDRAETYLTRALDQGYRDTELVRYYLGQVAEERKQDALAINRYESVAKGEYLVSARTRHAGILARQGKLDDALTLLRTTEATNDGQRIQLIQAEANLLREEKKFEAVYKLLDEAVSQRPDHVDLLYDRAMAAEKINKLDVTEADLRKVIKLKPDYAHAYNALGYTLVDKTTRLNEAAELLEKALSLAPDDAFILDSMGWLHYRKGNLDKASEYLGRAWKLRQDPEIAAHLGEVLWMKGSRDEASRLWDTSLQSNPDNEALLETLRKFKH
jgi:tetratricopeptide (TPR) repeat protein